MDRPVKVACVQVEPVVLDREATLDKLERVAAEAAQAGAELVVFPETFVPVYPSSLWAKAFAGWDAGAARETFARLAQHSIAVGSPAERRIAAAAQELGIWIVTGVNEVDPERPGTIYNSLLYHSPADELALHHRKLVPTNHERLVWGQGDGRGLTAVETGFGRLGGLICWENYMPLARVALYESGVEIYVASTADDGEAWQQTLVHIARESRTYVVAPAHFQREAAYPEDFPLAAEIEGIGTIGRGGSAILPACSPSGSASTRSATTAGPTCFSSPFARTVRRRVHVLPRDLPVPEREDVDPVPLLRAGRRGPFAHREVVADVERAGGE